MFYLITDGGSPVLEEKKLSAIEKRFIEMGERLDKELYDAQRAVELKHLNKELSSLDLLYSGFNKWFTSNQNHSLEQCRVSYFNCSFNTFVMNEYFRSVFNWLQCYHNTRLIYSYLIYEVDIKFRNLFF